MIHIVLNEVREEKGGIGVDDEEREQGKKDEEGFGKGEGKKMLMQLRNKKEGNHVMVSSDVKYAKSRKGNKVVRNLKALKDKKGDEDS